MREAYENTWIIQDKKVRGMPSPTVSLFDRAVYMSEPVAFTAPAVGDQFRHGIIYRSPPESFTQEHGQLQYVPFFSLLDPTNTDLLVAMHANSGQDMLDFLEKYILNPLAEIAVLELFEQGMASEKHPQNLMVIVDTDAGLPVAYGIRDMNGINIQVRTVEQCTQRVCSSETVEATKARLLDRLQ